MGSLLKQNWFVARKKFLLWLILIVLFAGSAWAALDFYSELGFTPGLGIVYAFFASVFIADAGSSGRLQNSIISGFSRTAVWLASFLTLLFCCILMVAATLLGDLAGTALAGRLDVYNPQKILFLFFSLCLNAAGYAGMFALACLLLTGRRSARGTLMLIVCCCIFIAVAIWGGNIENALWEPEMVTYYDAADVGIDAGVDIYYPEDEELEGLVTHQEPNPAYVAEPLRSQYEAVAEFLPVTQTLDMVRLLADSEEPLTDAVFRQMYVLWAYAGILTVCSAAAGLVLFRRRDLV